MLFPLLDVLGIGQAIWKLAYNIFVRGPLYIVHGLGDAISFLSGQKVVDLIFGTNGHFLSMPPEFIIFLVISFSLIIFFTGGVILHAMTGKEMKSTLASLANRLILIIILLLLIPLFFWVINFTVISIIHIIMPNLVDGRELADMVGKLGFVNNSVPGNWHYDQGYPDWENYNLFLGTFGTFFCLFVFFFLGLTLIKRLFDLFLLYVTSPIILSTAASNQKWQKVNIWKDLVIGRFISTLGIVLTLSLFMNLQPLMFGVADEISSNWTGQVAFKLLFIAGGAIASLNAQMLFSSLVGNTVGISDGIAMLATLKAGTAATKMGLLGVAGVSRFLFKGKQQSNNKDSNNSNTKKATSRYTGGFIGSVAKKSVNSVLATGGFATGVVATMASVGVGTAIKKSSQKISQPVTKLSSIIAEKSKQGFNKGFNKFEVSNKSEMKRELKNQLNTDPKNIEIPGTIKRKGRIPKLTTKEVDKAKETLSNNPGNFDNSKLYNENQSKKE